MFEDYSTAPDASLDCMCVEGAGVAAHAHALLRLVPCCQRLDVCVVVCLFVGLSASGRQEWLHCAARAASVCLLALYMYIAGNLWASFALWSWLSAVSGLKGLESDTSFHSTAGGCTCQLHNSTGQVSSCTQECNGSAQNTFLDCAGFEQTAYKPLPGPQDTRGWRVDTNTLRVTIVKIDGAAEVAGNW